jgi:2-polyprenyl-3-methyl-5-hydroxy-6-metoxy-1,4-benzoquinol methylase
MPDFSKRSQEIEIMDDLQCSGEVVHQTLRELETINTLLGGNYVTLDGLRKLIKNTRNPLVVADLGCGGGDILRLIKKWSLKKGLPLKLSGFDANPFIVSYAMDRTPAAFNINYEAMDIFSNNFKTKNFDIVTGTLFFHHFTHEELVRFFSQMKRQVRIGLVINDIHRHWFAYYSIRWLTGILSRSPMVKYDAPLSVLRAFKKTELIKILKESGYDNFTIRWMWAFRWQVIVSLG